MVVGLEVAGVGLWFAFACGCVACGLCCACLALCLCAVTVAADPLEHFESVVCVVSGVVEFCAGVGAAHTVGVVFADAVCSGLGLASEVRPVGWQLGASARGIPCHAVPLPTGWLRRGHAPRRCIRTLGQTQCLLIGCTR